MKIINKTDWNTRNLRSVICAVLSFQNKTEGKLDSYQKKNLVITIVNSRKSSWIHRSKLEKLSAVPHGMEDKGWIEFPSFSGYAYRNGYEMRLRIPSVEFCERHLMGLDLAHFGYLISHELDHIRGYDHKHMRDSWTRDIPKFRWLEEYYTVEKKKKKVKKVVDKVSETYCRVLSHIEQKKKDINRLKKALSKYEKKRKYYERNYSLVRLNSKKGEKNGNK